MANSSLAKRIERLEQQLTVVHSPDIVVGDDKSMEIGKIKYYPSPTAQAFHQSEATIRGVLGPVGSGKSTMCCIEIMRMALSDMVMCVDGVRRSKWVVLRNTYPQLKTTTIPTWLMWFSKIGKMKWDTPLNFKCYIYDDKGPAEIEVLFYSMDRDEDAGDLDSLEITGAYINEARGLPGEKQSIILNTLVDRAARYPGRAKLQNGDKLKKKIILDSNPPSTSHWWYNIFEVEKSDNIEIFKQPPGLIKLDNGTYETNPDAENLQYLPNNYYVEGAYGKTEEHIKVQLMGQYGSFLEGDRVYPMYNDDIHSVEKLDYIAGLPVILAWDFGCTPHVLFGQQDCLGRIQIVKELYDDNSDVETFARDVVRPYVDRVLIGYETISVGDPAGSARGHSNLTAFSVLKREMDHKAIPARSNVISTRIGAVQYFLGKLVGGRPALLISRSGCPRLREGFNGGYHYKIVAGEKSPNKNIFSHGQDANQYMCVYFRPEESTKVKNEFKPKIIKGALY